MRTVIVICVAILLPCQAFAAPIISCTRPSGSSIRIVLNAEKKFGATLHCIEGDFPTEGEACAPNDGYGLDYPTGTGELSGVVYRWQDYVGHTGPVYSAHIHETAIVFTGGYQGLGAKWSDQWTFKVDRTTGVGILEDNTDNTKPPKFRARFSCHAVTQKF